MILPHNYFQCENRLCQRVDREDHLWRRFASSGCKTSCRGCGGTKFLDTFQFTVREIQLIHDGAFEVFGEDPYLFHLWGNKARGVEVSTPGITPLHKRLEGVFS